FLYSLCLSSRSRRFCWLSNDPVPTAISALPLHDALPISGGRTSFGPLFSSAHFRRAAGPPEASHPGLKRPAAADQPLHKGCGRVDRKSTRLNSSHVSSSYGVFCLKKKITIMMRLVSPIRP